MLRMKLPGLNSEDRKLGWKLNGILTKNTRQVGLCYKKKYHSRWLTIIYPKSLIASMPHMLSSKLIIQYYTQLPLMSKFTQGRWTPFPSANSQSTKLKLTFVQRCKYSLKWCTQNYNRWQWRTSLKLTLLNKTIEQFPIRHPIRRCLPTYAVQSDGPNTSECKRCNTE